mmetsp:Transcript_20995/g.40122  ORF Transcript_20995/g.40122 Transcript_20995/m.40122 type:complete len:230 (+) Transcript_20995:1246-1935(+)
MASPAMDPASTTEQVEGITFSTPLPSETQPVRDTVEPRFFLPMNANVKPTLPRWLLLPVEIGGIEARSLTLCSSKSEALVQLDLRLEATLGPGAELGRVADPPPYTRSACGEAKPCSCTSLISMYSITPMPVMKGTAGESSGMAGTKTSNKLDLSRAGSSSSFALPAITSSRMSMACVTVGRASGLTWKQQRMKNCRSAGHVSNNTSSKLGRMPLLIAKTTWMLLWIWW